MSPERPSPRVVCDSRATVVRARRIAMIRDSSQLLLLLAVDYFFTAHPLTRIPMLSRDDSITVVALFNIGVAALVMLSRKLPLWTARRIARTWCTAERTRFARVFAAKH